MAQYPAHNLLMLLLAFLCTTAKATYYNRAQFYDKVADYGVAITSALQDNGTQVRIRVTAPVSHSWFALGSGSIMSDSLMFILYPNEENDGLTLSIRTTKEHHAPTPIKSGMIDATLTKSSIKDGIMSADLKWRGDTKGVIYDACDVKDEKQPFIWAVGSNQSIASNDIDFAINKHTDHGVFFVNMPQTQNMNIHDPVIEGKDNLNARSQPGCYYQLILAHAVLFVSALYIVFPIAVVGLRLHLPDSFKIHWMTQLTGSFLVLCAFAIAVTTSIIGVRYSSLTQPHQIVGILICLALALQVYFGREHHIHWVLWKKRTWYTYVHMSLGRVVMYGGMLNAALGFLLAKLTKFAIIVGIAELVVIIIVEFFAIRHWLKRSRNLIADNEPMVLKDYHKLKDVTVTETAVGEDEAQTGYYRQGLQ